MSDLGRARCCPRRFAAFMSLILPDPFARSQPFAVQGLTKLGITGRKGPILETCRWSDIRATRTFPAALRTAEMCQKGLSSRFY